MSSVALDVYTEIAGVTRPVAPNRIVAAMRPVSATILIDVPRERVFDLLCDLSLRESFTDHFMSDYRLQRVEPVGTGAAARFRTSLGWMDTWIEVAERPYLVREHGHGGRANLVANFTFWELAEGPSPTSCELGLTFWTEPATFLDKLRDRFRGRRRVVRDWKRALVRLRRLAEEGGSPQRVDVAGGDRLPAFVS